MFGKYTTYIYKEKQTMEQYRIGDFAKYLGVTPDLLKHYEDMGIIQSVRSESGYRYYPFHTTLYLIESIRLRNYGLTLREIRGILNEHSMVNAQVERLFNEKMELIHQEIALDQALTEDYADFCRWKEALESRPWDWEIRRSRRMYFLPHTDGHAFLNDPRIYEILNQWMSYIPIIKSARKTDPDGKTVWGFLADQDAVERLHLPLNDVVELCPPQHIFYYKFCASILRDDSETPDNPENPAFRQLKALGLSHAGPYFRVSLMPGDWERGLDYLYGYYAIPLAEEAPTS